jgi:transcriptional regulator with XRE-family HTH domain
MIGEKLKTALFYHNMTQKELAQKIGVTEVSMCRYCKDERDPKTETVVKICHTLKISSDWLLGLID